MRRSTCGGSSQTVGSEARGHPGPSRLDAEFPSHYGPHGLGTTAERQNVKVLAMLSSLTQNKRPLPQHEVPPQSLVSQILNMPQLH